MLTPERLFRLIQELIFLLLGGLLVWIGLSGRIFFDRRAAAWTVVSAAMLLWGARALWRRSPRGRWEVRTRGISLALTGAILLLVSRVPFAWVGPLLVAAGCLLVLRGLAATGSIAAGR